MHALERSAQGLGARCRGRHALHVQHDALRLIRSGCDQSQRRAFACRARQPEAGLSETARAQTSRPLSIRRQMVHREQRCGEHGA